jgi:hypothetical protein
VTSRWAEVEIYASFMKLTGELEVVAPDRLSDSVNQAERYLELRDTRAEPLSVNYPVLSRVEPHTTIAKSAVILLCPLDEPSASADLELIGSVRRPKLARQAVFNTVAFSLVGDIHLEPGQTLRERLESDPQGFLPLTASPSSTPRRSSASRIARAAGAGKGRTSRLRRILLSLPATASHQDARTLHPRLPFRLRMPLHHRGLPHHHDRQHRLRGLHHAAGGDALHMSGAAASEAPERWR